ncbi:putative glucan endo-1,3-beta-D-glucosidase [Lupinus albus]|uniref:Putative glucan endo-1,3-beta-D-glucosidase n=1 Tax=Lupinus albus TaxID=3870 RepID=A0A6A4MV58_LUPAL|nr:putative glucan endo-1,3-beta-D-glucosidase [Lupinus albus]
METSRVRMRNGIFFLYFTFAVISLNHCDADRSMKLLRGPKLRRNIINKNPKKLKIIKHFNLPSLFSTNEQPYSISSPLTMTPYESLPPNSLLENNSPYCEYPPPSTPSTTSSQPSTPSSIFPTQSPPPSPITIIPGPPGSLSTPTPGIDVSPPSTITPGSPNPVLNPPVFEPGPPETTMRPPYFEPSPPFYIPSPTPNPILNPPIIEPGPPETTMSPPYSEPNPPLNIPSPTSAIIPGPPITFPSPIGGGIVPSPTVFQPPIVYPPPSVPPPRNAAPSTTLLWCVAKPSVPDPIIQEAMNYACDSGAECDSILPNGPCFEPNSVYAHASYAFNSYWQKTKAAGGTCEFGGTAILVSIDPSFDGCRFINN